MEITQRLNAGYRGSSGNTRSINTSQVLLANYTYLIDTTAAAFTVYLPQAPANGTVVRITNPNSSFATNNLTVSKSGSDTIAGSATIILSENNKIVDFLYASLLGKWVHSNNNLTSIAGISAGGELAGTYPNPTLVNNSVIAKVLTGLNITGGSISATDSIVTAFGKLQNQVTALLGGAIFQSVWNASTNSPTLTSSTGTKGYYYIVSVAGSTNLDGITDWVVGDWAIYDGTAWRKVDNTDAVSSVNGFTGAVSLTTSHITEGSNLYFTNARAIGSTLTGYTSGAGTISASDTILQAIQKLNGNTIALTSSGTANYISKFSSGNLINSSIFDNGTNIGLFNTNTTYNFDVTGTGRFTGALKVDATTASTSTSTGALIVSGGVGIAGKLYVGSDIYIGNNALYFNAGADYLFFGGSFSLTKSLAVTGIITTTGSSAGFTINRRDTSAQAGSIYSSAGNIQIYSTASATDVLTINGTNGNTGIGLTPTAVLHIKAGTATANTAPLKFTTSASVLLTTPEAGVMEVDSSGVLYYTPVSTRQTVFTGNDGATAPSTAAFTVATNFYGSSMTSILGTPNSWASVVVNGTTYKMPLYL